MREMRNLYKILAPKFKKTEHLEDLNVNGKTLLKEVLKK
jgi:hypothetical protein